MGDRPRKRQQLLALLLLLLPALSAAGCSATQPDTSSSATPGTLASWSLLDAGAVTARSTSLQVGVMRIECAGGYTGPVLSTDLEFTEHEVRIGVRVEPLPDQPANCQANETVPHTVELGQRLGERRLVDASCLATGDAAVICNDDGMRWAP